MDTGAPIKILFPAKIAGSSWVITPRIVAPTRPYPTPQMACS